MPKSKVRGRGRGRGACQTSGPRSHSTEPHVSREAGRDSTAQTRGHGQLLDEEMSSQWVWVEAQPHGGGKEGKACVQKSVNHLKLGQPCRLPFLLFIGFGVLFSSCFCLAIPEVLLLSSHVLYSQLLQIRQAFATCIFILLSSVMPGSPLFFLTG